MLLVLTYISLISGGLLVLLLLAGIVGGLDLDVDVDAGHGDATGGPGGVGIIKGGLTFLSIGAWTTKLLLAASSNPWLSFLVGTTAGLVAVYLLSLAVRWMLSQEANVNWTAEEALRQSGDVYLRIPAEGEGIVRVQIKGGLRELKARSTQGADIPTGTSIRVDELTPDGVLLVSPTVSG